MSMPKESSLKNSYSDENTQTAVEDSNKTSSPGSSQKVQVDEKEIDPFECWEKIYKDPLGCVCCTSVTPFVDNLVKGKVSSLSTLFRYCLDLPCTNPLLFCLQHAKIILKSMMRRKLAKGWWRSNTVLRGWQESLIQWMSTFILLARGQFTPRLCACLCHYYKMTLPEEFGYQTAFILVLAREVRDTKTSEFATFANLLAKQFMQFFRKLPDYLENTIKNTTGKVSLHPSLIGPAVQMSQKEAPRRYLTFFQFWRLYYELSCSKECHAPENPCLSKNVQDDLGMDLETD